MNDQEGLRRADQAKQILDSPLWIEAWGLYRSRLLDIIERADSAATEQVMQAKRLLTAGAAAQAHLTAILNDGKIAAESIKIEAERKRLWNRTGTEG